MKDKDTNCCLPRLGSDKNTQTNVTNTNKNRTADSAWSEPSDNEDVSDWGPTDSDLQSTSSDSSDMDVSIDDHVKERKFFVFESCLLQLFSICSLCLSPFIEKSKTVIGSLIKIKTTCVQGHQKTWYSQPMLGDMPMGNFLISASTLFSGCQPAKILLFLRHLWSPCFTERTYNRIQKMYLIPAVMNEWQFQQNDLIKEYWKTITTIGGDARMDSPGHTAKYGSYSIMDLDTNKIISVQTLQVSIFKTRLGSHCILSRKVHNLCKKT